MQKTRARFLKFILIGGIATAVHYAVTLLLTLSGLAPLVASSTIGFLLSALANYLMNARFTFGADAANAGQGGRFVLTVASGCAFNAGLLHAGVLAGLPAIIAQPLATIVVLFWNYALSSRWVFRVSS